MEGKILERGAEWPKFKEFTSIEELVEYSRKNPKALVAPASEPTRIYRCGALVEEKK